MYAKLLEQLISSEIEVILQKYVCLLPLDYDKPTEQLVFFFSRMMVMLCTD